MHKRTVVREPLYRLGSSLHVAEYFTFVNLFATFAIQFLCPLLRVHVGQADKPDPRETPEETRDSDSNVDEQALDAWS